MKPSAGKMARAALSVATIAVSAAALVIGAGTADAAGSKYVALGDSYSSGVGTRQYINDGTNCQRSVYAYPELTAQKLGYTLNFQACSGAKTSDVLANQVGALDSTTKYVTITIGGNDAGFSNVIERCALPFYNCTGDINNAETFIRDQLPAKLDSVYTAIHQKAPNAKVLVIGYPHLFNGVECNAFARLSSQEQHQLNGGADLLDSTIAAAAGRHAFTFVDVRQAFTGHAVCDNVEWLNGLSDPLSESYHPNRLGHANGFTPLVSAQLKAAPIRTSRAAYLNTHRG